MQRSRLADRSKERHKANRSGGQANQGTSRRQIIPYWSIAVWVRPSGNTGNHILTVAVKQRVLGPATLSIRHVQSLDHPVGIGFR